MGQKGEIIMNEVTPDLDALALVWDRKVVEIAGLEQTQMEAAFKNLVEGVERNMGGGYERTSKTLGTIGNRILSQVIPVVTGCVVDEKVDRVKIERELLKIKDEPMKQAVKNSAQFLLKIEPLQEIPYNFRAGMVVGGMSSALESLRPPAK